MSVFLVNNPLCLDGKLVIVSDLLIPSCALTAQIWPQAFKSFPVLKNPWSVPELSVDVFVSAHKHLLAHLFGLSFTIPSERAAWDSDQYKLRIVLSYHGPV